MRLNDPVSITCGSLSGRVVYVGMGRIVKEVKDTHGKAYHVKCDDGKTREVSIGNPSYRHDSIMVL